MTKEQEKALEFAKINSAMEGLPLTNEDIHIVVSILEGKMTMETFINSLQKKKRGSHNVILYGIV